MSVVNNFAEFPLGLENLGKWESIFHSGKIRGILIRLEVREIYPKYLKSSMENDLVDKLKKMREFLDCMAIIIFSTALGILVLIHTDLSVILLTMDYT